ncbi:carbohydrate ABC transporter substrate-binding protein (CUT1 family) [Hydrogenispora ethanolica]|jgi:multiple sugar transport system substrate-binding protein|uniref:Carbohydrate ABC transporter substrate-binding protein (CUT1 family) n=1 Tax=Hydrogenispora ethanolica TaxID=1082276 RepID=A0A4R1RU17_HYDET|nr:sugar ABC transporter substrate-binding protein [Hydrogenispora ethanolica]TCL70041.1 carbohydrate ABC transporter substrate-binding protein (CUT1 family) [Hydrogenispora ethanolica]
MLKKMSLLGLLTLVLLLTAQTFAAPAVITFLSPETDPSSIKVDNSIIAAFEKSHPGVKVKLTHANLNDVLPKLSAMLRAGTAPDLAYSSPKFVPPLVDQGQLVTMDDVFKKLGDIPRKFVTVNSKGRIYDIPAAQEVRLLYYRKDLFTAAGIKPPTTFDQWLKAAKALTVDTNNDGKIDQYGISVTGAPPEVSYDFACLLWANGAELFDSKLRVAIDSPKAVEALEFLGKLKEFSPPGVANTTYKDVSVNFANGVAAMALYPGRMLLNIDRYNPGLAPKVGIVPVPYGPGNESKKPLTHTAINNFIIFKTSKNVKAAKEFVTFYMQDKQYLAFLVGSAPGHSLPVRNGWLKNPDYFADPAIAKWKDLVKESMDYSFKYGTDFLFRHPGIVDPYVGRATADPTFSREMNRFISGESSAKQALTATGEAWREMFGIK